MVIRDHFHFLLPEPFPCAVLSCPAPNRTALIERDAGGRDLARADDAITRRIALILDTVASLKPGATILGGWGCGVFGNDPGLVAKRFVEALKAPESGADSLRVARCPNQCRWSGLCCGIAIQLVPATLMPGSPRLDAGARKAAASPLRSPSASGSPARRSCARG